MSFLKKLLGKKEQEPVPSVGPAEPTDAPASDPQDKKDPSSLAKEDDEANRAAPEAAPPPYQGAGPNPNIRNLGAPPPPHLQSAYGNAGMQAGMFASMAGGGSMGGDMMLGQVAGGMIGQRIDQVQQHAYWKQRQAEYLAGNP